MTFPMPASRRLLACLISLLLLAPPALGAQETTARLTTSLGADVAQRVLGRIAAARELGLPADALEQRALELTAKGIAPLAVERQVGADAAALSLARRALAEGGALAPRPGEIEAAAAAMRRGVSAGAISALAAAGAPTRPLALPLFVVSSLIDRGATVERAVTVVAARLTAGVPDDELLALSYEPRGPVPPMAPARGAVQTSRPRPRPVPTFMPPRARAPARH